MSLDVKAALGMLEASVHVAFSNVKCLCVARIDQRVNIPLGSGSVSIRQRVPSAPRGGVLSTGDTISPWTNVCSLPSLAPNRSCREWPDQLGAFIPLCASLSLFLSIPPTVGREHVVADTRGPCNDVVLVRCCFDEAAIPEGSAMRCRQLASP